MIQEYTQAVLLAQLRVLALSKRQREIVVNDVTRRLESVLSNWSDLAFRRTILILGTEEATFWEPLGGCVVGPEQTRQKNICRSSPPMRWC